MLSKKLQVLISGKIWPSKLKIFFAEESSVEKHYTEVGLHYQCFLWRFVEETLIQPTFVYGHPVAVSHLLEPEDERFAAVSELFILTKEYGNAFTEAQRSIDQLGRFGPSQAKNWWRWSSWHWLRLHRSLEYGILPMVVWESVSTVFACSLILLLSVMCFFSQLWNKN